MRTWAGHVARVPEMKNTQFSQYLQGRDCFGYIGIEGAMVLILNL